MLFHCALPNSERAFILKRKNHQALCESLVYLKDKTASLLSESERKKFQILTDDLKKNPNILFPFTLLNETLVQFAQENAVDAFKAYLTDFEFKRKQIETHLSVFPFGNACLAPTQWQLCERILTSEFPEEAYVQTPSKGTFKQTSTLVQNALREIKKISPNYFAEIEALVSNMMVVHSNRFIAGSSFTLLGLVTLVDNHDPNMTAEYIIHEAAHQYLYNLMACDEICSGAGLHTSPLRKDPRPIEGVYHAAFVLARIIDFYNKALTQETTLPKNFMEKQIAYYRPRYKDAYDLLMEKATFTDLGQKLLESSKEMVL
ncbi:MAG TPA: hypothetical protein DD412_01015 [Holosporales bacterium]|nr:hypothetical protein [Holosporales bacterium]